MINDLFWHSSETVKMLIISIYVCAQRSLKKHPLDELRLPFRNTYPFLVTFAAVRGAKSQNGLTQTEASLFALFQAVAQKVHPAVGARHLQVNSRALHVAATASSSALTSYFRFSFFGLTCPSVNFTN